MDQIEKDILENNPTIDIHKIVKYYRYVDDILIIFDGNEEEAMQMLSKLNKLHVNIKFKIEIGHNSINFLDINISMNEMKKLEFNVYRKDSYTDAIIPNTSITCDAHKKAFFNFVVDRMIKLNMSTINYNREKQLICDIASNNGYNISDIYKIIRKRKSAIDNNTLYSTIVPENNTKKYIRIPFLGPISYNIAHELKLYGLTAAFYPVIKIYHTLSNLKNINPLQKSGVYKITCSCGVVYIGQSGRALGIRVKEHLACARRYNTAKKNKVSKEELQSKYYNKSAMSDHLIDTQHPVESCTYKILHTCEHGRKMDILEQLEISNHIKQGNCLNDRSSNPKFNYFS